MKIKIIGTGLSGLVGSRIVELLKDQYDFVDLSLDTGVDVLDINSIETAFQNNLDVPVVLHLAAYTDTNAAWLQKEDKTGPCFRLNVEGTQNILNLCKKYGKHLIYISTDFVFDGTKNDKYTEEDTPNPIEWYGKTKHLGEKVILDSEYPSTIVRIAYPYRSNFESKKDIIRKIINNLQTGQTCNMFGDQITTTTFVDDIANGLRYFIDNKIEGIFHLVGSSSQSPYEMCLKVAEVFGLDKNLINKTSLDEFVKSQPEGSRPWQKYLAISNEKVKSLGIQMKTLEEGLIEMKKQIENGK